LPLLPDIVVMVTCVAVYGADNGVDVENLGKAKHDWLKEFKLATSFKYAFYNALEA